MDYCKNSSLAVLVHQEELRQKEGITLIASENYPYQSVLNLLGSVLTAKYAEGYPGKRYYAGCEYVDKIELFAQEKCKQLFKGEYANVQPHSGSAANMAVYMALLKPGDTLMGMSLASGGHLTHGHAVSFSGIFYNSVQYTVNPESHRIDYEDLEKQIERFRPRLVVAGASSYSRLIDFEKIAQIAHAYNAYVLADCAHTAGLIRAGLHPQPFPFVDCMTATTHKTLRGPRGGFIVARREYAQLLDRAVFPLIQGGPFMNVIAAKGAAFECADSEEFVAYMKQSVINAQSMVTYFKERGYSIVSGGTDIHLFVIDLSSRGMNGRFAEQLLEQAGIFVSRSTVPFDKEKPWLTSGIRIGTLALTARGATEDDAQEVACIIDALLSSRITFQQGISRVKELAKKLTELDR